MDLELSEDQLAFRENFRAVLAKDCAPALVRRLFDNGEEGVTLWDQAALLGWPALAVPESNGGLGYGFVERGLLAEELGRAAAPATLLATVTQFTSALVEAGADDVLMRVAAGEVRGALGFAEAGRWSLDALSTRAVPDGSGWRLHGRKDAVLAGVTADVIAVVAVAGDSDEPGIFLIESPGDTPNVKINPRAGIDPGLLLADFIFDGAPAVAIAPPSPRVRDQLSRIQQESAVAMALHGIGACRQVFEMTLEYAKVRKQYDRVIGSFQALKHRFADLYLSVERSTALCYFAAVAIAEDHPEREEVAHLAKAAVGDCQALVAQDGLQLHGGIGYTWEQDLHFWLKRAKSSELLCGSAAWHRAQVASSLGLMGPAQEEVTS